MCMKKSILALAFFSFLSLTPVGHAAEASSSQTYVGALLGLGSVNNSGGTNFTYGVSAGFKFNPSVSLGLDYNYNTFTVPSPLSANLSLILVNFKYYFANGFFGGLKLGSGSISYSGTGAPANTNTFAWGPTLGYDYFCSPNWSVGGEANLISINNNASSLSTLQLLASLKYWF